MPQFNYSPPVWANTKSGQQLGYGNTQEAYGLDPSMLSTKTVGGAPGKAAGWMDVGYAPTPGTQQTIYNGPGGQWTNTNGSWSNASGTKVNDLAGYLNMKDQQAKGADFSGYQKSLNQALNQQNQAGQQYQNLLLNPNAVQQTAGYQFALDQGNQAINRSAAAKGSLNSGNVLAELAKYGQGMASQQYQQQLGNLQQNFQNQATKTNTLADLMRNSQQFGIGSGYYQPPQNFEPNTTSITGMAYRPSNW